jgi:hypothetical protein
VNRVLSRVLVVVVMSSIGALALVGTAWAPRSWFLPNLQVACHTGDGKVEEFTGAFDLNGVAVVKDVITVGGTVSGTCGPLSIDTAFRAPITVENASCDGARLVVGDTTVRDTTINMSEQPIEVTTADVGRGPLCKLAASAKASQKAQVNALNKVLSYLA